MYEFNNIKEIGVISDTHIPIRANSIPKKVFEIFKNVNLILHAGDLVQIKVIEELKKIAYVIAVKGNMDRFENMLPERAVIKVNKRFKIGLCHGDGPPDDLPERVNNEFSNVDCIVFGHSHHPFNEIKNGILLFNPGSACDTVFANINSVGILHVKDKIRGEIIRL